MPSRILIADDHDNVRKVVRAFLERARDIEVCAEASTGLEVLEEAEKCNPDLVVLDLSLPDLNGIMVASVLKKKMPRTKIILYTMYKQYLGHQSLASAVGVDAVLAKPGEMGQMVECIKSLLAA
jgi:two-component system NarL family response regulator